MALQIKKATRLSKKIKLALIGIAGSGKTYSALAIAKGLGERILVIDTEHGSASAYAEFGFDTIELDSFSPATYVEGIRAAEDGGYDVVILDSLSHAWTGKDGALEMMDKASRRSQSGNSFTAWKDVTPEHNKMVEAIVGAKCHVIVTLRAKTEYIVEAGKNGKSAPRKVGLAPIQRDGMEYEFDLVGTIDQEHFMTVTKSRIASLSDQVIQNPGAQVAATLKEWISSGSPLPPASVATPTYTDVPDPSTLSGSDLKQWFEWLPANEPDNPATQSVLKEVEKRRAAARAKKEAEQAQQAQQAPEPEPEKPTIASVNRDKIAASKLNTEGLEVFNGEPDGIERPVEVVMPEKKDRPVSKRLMATITAKGLSMAPADKIERLRACNAYLLSSNVQIKSFKELEPAMAAHLAVGIQDDLVTWGAVEAEVVE